MKGTLHKTEIGWVVRWTQEDPRDQLPELLLLPIQCDFLDKDDEVEFDWCVIVDHDTGKGKQYAKLIQPREKISDESWEGCDGCTEQDKYFWTKGYQAGYNRATSTEISDDRTKLHWKTSLVVHTPEISDEEIEKFADEELGTIRTDFDFGVIQGMKWYREQLKNNI